MSACRPACAACCIAPSISPVSPALPDGKPAGVPCPHLTDDLRCALFGSPDRPPVCGGLAPGPEMCGASRDEAIGYLTRLERLTAPPRPAGAARPTSPRSPRSARRPRARSRGTRRP